MDVTVRQVVDADRDLARLAVSPGLDLADDGSRLAHQGRGERLGRGLVQREAGADLGRLGEDVAAGRVRAGGRGAAGARRGRASGCLVPPALGQLDDDDHDHDHADDGRGQVQGHPRPGEMLRCPWARTRRARTRPRRAAAGGDVVIVVTRTGRSAARSPAARSPAGRTRPAVGVLGVRVLDVRVLSVRVLRVAIRAGARRAETALPVAVGRVGRLAVRRSRCSRDTWGIGETGVEAALTVTRLGAVRLRDARVLGDPVLPEAVLQVVGGLGSRLRVRLGLVVLAHPGLVRLAPEPARRETARAGCLLAITRLTVARRAVTRLGPVSLTGTRN